MGGGKAKWKEGKNGKNEYRKHKERRGGNGPERGRVERKRRGVGQKRKKPPQPHTRLWERIREGSGNKPNREGPGGERRKAKSTVTRGREGPNNEANKDT